MDNTQQQSKKIIAEIKSEAIAHKDSSLKRLDLSFIKHIEAEEYKKSNLLAYWINDFSNYHDNEKKFKTTDLKTFKRGDIIKVNLGFNIGNELGGLHYCVVLNKNDNPYNGTLNVVPLTSKKENKGYNSDTCIDLGDELYISLLTKVHTEFNKIKKQLSNLKEIESTKKFSQKLEYLDKLQNELLKMKHGSFALLHQITTISKQRIYKTSILAGIKISNNSLDLMDKKIIKLYTK